MNVLDSGYMSSLGNPCDSDNESVKGDTEEEGPSLDSMCFLEED